MRKIYEKVFSLRGSDVVLKYLVASTDDASSAEAPSGGRLPFAVILQGWATESTLYEGVIATLEKKYTVIFPLLPGFGETPEPSEALSVGDCAELVNRLLTDLRVTRAEFFCHSYGGRVFFKLNAMEERFTEPAGVVLCDVAGIVPMKTLKQKISQRYYKFARKVFSSRAGRFFFPEALDELRHRYGSADYNSASEVMRRALVMAVNEDERDLFPLLTAPTLVLWGVLDDQVPLSDAYLIKSAVKDAEVIEFAGSGHFPFLTEPGAFYPVIRAFFEIGGGV